MVQSQPITRLANYKNLQDLSTSLKSLSNLQSDSLLGYHELLEISLYASVLSDRPLSLKLSISDFIQRLIFKHFTIMEYYKTSKPILIDEGLLMNIRGLEHTNFNKNPQIINILPTTVISCQAPKKTVLERYKNRMIQQGKNITTKEAEIAFETTNERSQIILSKLMETNVKLLPFDVTNPSEMDIATLIKNLENRKP
jgi:hypothetical protein